MSTRVPETGQKEEEREREKERERRLGEKRKR
jgi:hypothetical protein